MRKRWVWLLVAFVVLGGFFFFLRVENLSSPTIDYDLNDPMIVSITQGTEGAVGPVQIGLRYVDGISAGVSVFNSEQSAVESSNLILEVGQPQIVDGVELMLVDALPGRDTAVIKVVLVEE